MSKKQLVDNVTRGLFSRLDREETTCLIKLGRQEIRFVVHGKTLNRSGGEERRVLKLSQLKLSGRVDWAT